MNTLPIVEEWRKVKVEDNAPHIFPGDEIFFDSTNSFIDITNYQKCIGRIDEINENPAKVHLNLIPLPYVGNLSTARIIILTGNPGFGLSDYEAEEHPEMRQDLINNLRQENFGEYPFLFLNPNHAWHGGYSYWVGKLEEIIEEIIKVKQLRYFEALKTLSQIIAVVEYTPYHSKTSPGINNLRSSKKIVDFIKTSLAQSKDHLIVATRKAKEWGLIASESNVIYDNNQARGASLGRNTSGGKSIIWKFHQLIS